MKVSKGLSTWAGLATALAQYLGAVALFLEADDQALALGPLATATLTLVTVIAGRMRQANTLAEMTVTAVPDSSSTTAGWMTRTGGNANVTWTTPRPGAAMTNVTATPAELEEPGDPDALPEYETTENPAPDEGDEDARPEATA